jgi:NAD-dependent dihydropyrimidine dehydrogenase PreA subunit
MKGALQLFGPAQLNMTDCTLTDLADRAIHGDQFSLLNVNLYWCFFYEVEMTSPAAFIRIDKEGSPIPVSWCCFQGISNHKYTLDCTSHDSANSTVILGFENCFSSETAELAILGAEIVNLEVCDANAHYDCRICRRACPTVGFTASSMLKHTDSLSDSDNFNSSEQFSNSGSFTRTQGLSKTANNWTQSKFLPRSLAFPRSDALPRTDEFPESDIHGNLTTVFSSAALTTSVGFSSSDAIRPSDHFPRSDALVRSVRFNASAAFNSSQEFTNSRNMTATGSVGETDVFNETGTLGATLYFTQSR